MSTTDDLINGSYQFFDILSFALMFSILFSFLYELNATTTILVLLFSLHFIFNVKMYKHASSLFKNVNVSIIGLFASFIILTTTILRTLGIMIFTYGYTNAAFKSSMNDKKLEFPKKYKLQENEYKFSYIVSTVLIFILLIMILSNFNIFSEPVIKFMIPFNVFSSLIALLVSFGLSNIIEYESQYKTSIYTFIINIGGWILYSLSSFMTGFDNKFSNLMIIFLSTITLLISSIHEFVNAYYFEKYHYKIKSEPNEKDNKKDDNFISFVELIVNIFTFLIAFIVITLMGLYAFGTESSKFIYILGTSLIITSFISYNSYFKHYIKDKI